MPKSRPVNASIYEGKLGGCCCGGKNFVFGLGVFFVCFGVCGVWFGPCLCLVLGGWLCFVGVVFGFFVGFCVCFVLLVFVGFGCLVWFVGGLSGCGGLGWWGVGVCYRGGGGCAF